MKKLPLAIASLVIVPSASADGLSEELFERNETPSLSRSYNDQVGAKRSRIAQYYTESLDEEKEQWTNGFAKAEWTKRF